MTKLRTLTAATIAITLVPISAGPITAAHATQSPRQPLEYRELAQATPPTRRAPSVPRVRTAPAQIRMPAPEAMIVMIRSSVVALSHANTTNNYSVLNQMGSPQFRRTNSISRLSKAFAPFRSNNIDLAPVVFLTPQLTQQPRIANGRLKMVGYFPSQPMRVNFDLEFEPSDGIWKLYGLAVNLQRAPQVQARRPTAPRTPLGRNNAPSSR